MKITRDGDRLILTTGDGRPWVSSLFVVLFVGGIAATILVALVKNVARDGFSIATLGGVIIPIVIIAFGRQLLAAHHATVEIDQRFGRVSVERRYFFKTIREKLKFDELKGFAIHETEDDGSPRYQLKLECLDGRQFILGQRIADGEAVSKALVATQIEFGTAASAVAALR